MQGFNFESFVIQEISLDSRHTSVHAIIQPPNCLMYKASVPQRNNI